MPLFDYSCACGMRFEKLVSSWRSTNPACPECNSDTRRLPGRIALIGGAGVPVGDEKAPASWEGVRGGDREYVAHWRRTLEKRKTFEEKNPEHAVKRDAIAAHEGVFEAKPLTYRELVTRATDSKDATTAAQAASRDRVTTGNVPAGHHHGS